MQRIEVGDVEMRIARSEIEHLQTLATKQVGSGVEPRVSGVRSFDLKWLPGPDSNQATNRLTASCSTAELPGNNGSDMNTRFP